jgi:hypothetical protein
MAITSNPINQNGALITAQGTKTFMNITAATLVKVGTGRVAKVSVIAHSTAGSQNAAVADHATTSGVNNSNLIAVIPDVVGTYNIDMPTTNGIVLVPGGAGQVLAISYI